MNEPNELKPFILFDAYSQIDSTNNNITEDLMEYATTYDANLSPTTTTELVGTTTEYGGAGYKVPSSSVATKKSIKESDYLAIVVDKNDVYSAYVGVGDLSSVTWYIPEQTVNVNQFKGLDMWNKFEGINEMIYFILTKYEQDIVSIETSYMKKPEQPYYKITITGGNPDEVTSNFYPKITKTGTENNIKYSITYIDYIDGEEKTQNNLSTKPTVEPRVDKGKTEIEVYDKDDKERQNDGKLWCYINPRTMKPYLDDYWFHENEPYYIKSLTLVDNNKELDAKKITVRSDVWPGMYMMVGETYIRNRDTGDDEHLQLVIPQAKVKSEQSLTLQPDGEPTVFNMNLEVAQPKSKVMMEINTYKTKLKMTQDENGYFTAVDGSSEVVVM